MIKKNNGYKNGYLHYYPKFFLFLFWVTQPSLSDICKVEVHFELKILFWNRKFQLENVKTKCADFSKFLSSLFYPLLLAAFKKLFWSLRNEIVWADLLFAFFCLISYLSGMGLCNNSVEIHSFVSPSFSLIPCSFWNWPSLKFYPQVHLNVGEPWSLAPLTVVGWTLNPRSEKSQPFGKLWCKLQTSQLNAYCLFILSA